MTEMTTYLKMLVMSIPTNTTLTGNQTLINFHVRGSVDITPNRLRAETIVTETRFCNHRITGINILVILYSFFMVKLLKYETTKKFLSL